MERFFYAQPVKIYFGEGEANRLDDILEESGISRCILVTSSSFRTLADKLMRSRRFLKHYSGVQTNPLLSDAEAIAAVAKESKAEAIVAIGGGSVIDAAKMASVLVNTDANPEDIYNGKVAIPQNGIKIIAVPTTAGTGSEVTGVSVISHNGDKKPFGNRVFYPLAAVVDPELTYSLPKKATVITGMDALSHALEGFWSVNHTPVTDILAIESVKLVCEGLEAAYHNGSDVAARRKLAYGSLLAGLSFAIPKTAGCHACSYPLTIMYGLPHGEACAFTLDSFVKINKSDRLAALIKKAGFRDAEELSDRINEIKRLAGLKVTLGDIGNVDVEKLARACEIHPTMANNPIKMTKEMLVEMFENLR